MKFLTACPDESFFHWQLKVLYYNLIEEHKVKPSDIICLIGYKGNKDKSFFDYCEKIGITVHGYDISKLDMSYSPIIRPHLFKKFYKEHSYIKDEHVFIHDSDIIFRELPNFAGFTNDNWYVSDCSGYLGYNYLKIFGDTLIKDMCNAVGIDEFQVVINDVNCGGAQYYGKDLTWKFWEKVEKDTLSLYEILRHQTPTNKEEYFEINGRELTTHNAVQVWTAGMWADLWNLYLYKNVISIPELDFSTATMSKDEYFKRKIYHDAGVMDNMKDTYFHKGSYRYENPFYVYHNYHVNYASYYYSQAINNTREYLLNGNLL